MNFKGLRKFAGNEFTQVTRYLAGTLATFASDLATGLQQLTFADNFACFQHNIAVDHSAQFTFANQFQTPAVDILFMNNTQPFQVVSIDADNITIENYGGIAAATTVVVFRR